MSQFAQYVRSASFRLELSEYMIQALLTLYETGHAIPYRNLQPYEALCRRGLVEFYGSDLRRHDKSIRITQAGIAVINLLELAGYARREAAA